MRRVAVTGASGLIGTALTAALEKRGDRVVPIGRHPPDGGVAWDLAARRIDGAALEGVDAVVHLAGERIDGRWTATKKRRILDSPWREPSCWPEHWLAWAVPPPS